MFLADMVLTLPVFGDPTSISRSIDTELRLTANTRSANVTKPHIVAELSADLSILVVRAFGDAMKHYFTINDGAKVLRSKERGMLLYMGLSSVDMEFNIRRAVLTSLGHAKSYS